MFSDNNTSKGKRSVTYEEALAGLKLLIDVKNQDAIVTEYSELEDDVPINIVGVYLEDLRSCTRLVEYLSVYFLLAGVENARVYVDFDRYFMEGKLCKSV